MRRAILFAMLLTGCSQILDLQDRKLDDGAAGSNDAGADALVDPESGILTTSDCEQYCTLADQLCTADAGVQLFQTYATCLAVCDKYPKTDSLTGDTLKCRLTLLQGLKATGSNEARTTCPGAGPGGGPPPDEPTGVHCGNDCQGFCDLRSVTCPPDPGDVNCPDKCQALVDDTVYNAAQDFGSGSDTLGCRIAHLSAAAYYDETEVATDDAGTKPTRDAHCSHSGIRSEVQCDFPMDQAPDCASYCKIVMTACTTDSAVYENNDQCLAVCAFMDPGTSGDTSTVGSKRCYRSGAYNALEGLADGCEQASIAGDACQGGRCASYCYFAQKACPDAFKAAYPSNSLTDCANACNQLPAAASNSAYSLTLDLAQSGNNVACRLKQLTRAMGSTTGMAANCSAALGLGSPCQ